MSEDDQQPLTPAVMAWRLIQLERAVKQMQEEERERKRGEKRGLIAGITLFGSIIMTLIGVLWANLASILRGIN